MASSIFQQLMEAVETDIKAQMVSAGTLPFATPPNGVFQIVNGPPDSDVKLRRYGIFIYPGTDPVSETPRIGDRVLREMQVGVSCMRKLPSRSRWRLFSNPNDAQYGVGAFEMANRVMDILRNNNFNNLVSFSRSRQFSVPQYDDSGDSTNEHVIFEMYRRRLSTVTSGGVD